MSPDPLLPERDHVALTIYGEARGEKTEGRIAVACVLRSRLKSRRWGGTYAQVCHAPFQFSCWNPNDPNRELLMALAGTTAPRDNPVLRECYWIADGLLANAILPRVGQSTHYYAPVGMPTAEPPRWARNHTPFAVVGRHLFFEDIA